MGGATEVKWEEARWCHTLVDSDPKARESLARGLRELEEGVLTGRLRNSVGALGGGGAIGDGRKPGTKRQVLGERSKRAGCCPRARP